MRRKSSLKCAGASPVAAVALAVLVSAAGGNAEGQAEPAGESAAQATAKFYPSRDVELFAPPAVPVVAGTQCDASGDVYVYASSSIQDFLDKVRNHQPLNLPLRKVSIDSQRVVSFPVGPFEGYDRFISHGFYVTPNGVVYNRAEACKGGQSSEAHETCAWLVTRYNDDGTVDSVARLHPPREEFLIPCKLAAFPDGNLVVVGMMRDEKGDMTLFAGLFDRRGDFLRELALPEDVGPAPVAAPTPNANPAAGMPRPGPSDSGTQTAEARARSRLVQAVSEGRVFGAPDGTVYLLRGGSPQKLDVLSSDGSVVPKPDITPPRDGLTTIGACLNAQGRIVVHYVSKATPEDPKQYRVIAVVDPETGKVISTYDAPLKAEAPAWVTREGEFLFTR